MHTSRITLLLVASLAVCASGCGRNTGEPAADGTEAAAPAETIPLPEDFPDDIYLLPDARILHAVTAPETSTVAYETASDPAAAAGQYALAMADMGWSARPPITLDGVILAAFEKAGRVASLVLTPGAPATRISLVVSFE